MITFRRLIRYSVLLVSCLGFAGALKFMIVDRELMAVLGALILALPSLGVFFYLNQAQEEDPFISWLKENAELVRAGTAMYKGSRITPDTQLTQFQACTSLIFWSGKYTSRLQVEGIDSPAKAKIFFSLLALLTGWWSIHGIVWTVQVLHNNLKGGRKTTVREFLY